MTSRCTIRVVKELRNLEKESDLSLAATCMHDNVRNVRALIIGPPDTPYEFGFFEFDFTFPEEYPIVSPKVKAITTGRGRLRFNPNIYACGKICLSILGTWRGESGEQWSTAQGLESILVSIQSLLSSDPYSNEPGFEDPEGESAEKASHVKYAEKIRHETLRVTVIKRLERAMGLAGVEAEEDARTSKRTSTTPTITSQSPASAPTPPQMANDAKKSTGSSAIYSYDATDDLASASADSKYSPFIDLCKRRFLWYYDVYVASIDKAAAKSKPKTVFDTTNFEYPGNELRGTFDFPDLSKRIIRVRQAIDSETLGWAELGLRGTGVASSTRAGLLNRLVQAQTAATESQNARYDISMLDDNPFVWVLTLFGKPESNLEGAIISIEIRFPPTFPDEQPRVSVQTPLFHHRISSTGGILCYKAQDLQNPISHVTGIIEALEDEQPRFDPRTLVNMEASKLLWGDEQQKKTYGRKLRRSVQDSLEL